MFITLMPWCMSAGRLAVMHGMNIELYNIKHYEWLVYFYSSSLDSRNINSALQILEFDGTKFNHAGVFKSDSLDASNNFNF